MRRREVYFTKELYVPDTILGMDGEWQILDYWEAQTDIPMEFFEELQYHPGNKSWRLAWKHFSNGEWKRETDDVDAREAIRWWLRNGDTPESIRSVLSEYLPLDALAESMTGIIGRLVAFLCARKDGVSIQDLIDESIFSTDDHENIVRAINRYNERLLRIGLEIETKPLIKLVSR